MIDGSLAYQKDQPKIPKHSALVIDIEVQALTNEPTSLGDYEDTLLVEEIKILCGEG